MREKENKKVCDKFINSKSVYWVYVGTTLFIVVLIWKVAKWF